MGLISTLLPGEGRKPTQRKLAQTVVPNGIETRFDPSEIIVSKTDLVGRITYANRCFLRVAASSERELLGAPHSVIRHPDMPRCVFKLLWDTLAAKQEIFAYVKNLARDGNHYWVFAHVTPSFDSNGNVVGYHSSRRVPDRSVIDEKITPLYRALLAEEERHHNRKDGLQKSTDMLLALLKERGIGYDEFVFTL